MHGQHGRPAITTLQRTLLFTASAAIIFVLAALQRISSLPGITPGANSILQIPAESPLDNQYVAAVPVIFAANGRMANVTMFSIDFDETCLLFDPVDADHNQIPDNITFNVSNQFIQSVAFDAGDSDSELDIMIADYTQPYAVLPDGVLLTMRLAAICQAPPDAPITAPVRFSLAPAPSLSTGAGSELRVDWLDGSVLITANPAAPTPAPTATATPGPTTTPTPGTIPPPTPGTIPPTPNANDPDVDGIMSQEEGASDWDGDGIPNYLDADDDNDGIPTLLEGVSDVDGGGVPNFLDLDSNGNDISDTVEAGDDPLHPVDRDGNGIYDFLDIPYKLHLPLIVREWSSTPIDNPPVENREHG